MERDIYIVGLNHRSAAVEVRERFALALHCEPSTWAIPCTGNIAESLILSTCNRVEILACGTGDVANTIIETWSQVRGKSPEELKPYVYVHKNLDAVRHLFTVASSLDSMVLGEPQILGQLKDAYRKSVTNKSAGIISNKLLHKAFSVAKRVRTETAVASSAVSISYAAVELAKRIFGDMREYNAMLIGAGEMAELAATHLLQAGIQNIIVANRTLERGRELAKEFNGHAIAFDKLTENLAQVDIVITSTGSTEPILCAQDIEKVLHKRKHRPMFFIDIAVPRDIAPDVNTLENVYLYDIDDLKEVVEENLANRKEEADKAIGIVDEEVNKFHLWLRSLDVQPTIVQLLDRSERLAELEVARTLKRLGTVSEDTKDALETMAQALLRKFHHHPIAFLKRGTMAEEGVAPRIDLMRRIFNLDEDFPEGDN